MLVFQNIFEIHHFLLYKEMWSRAQRKLWSSGSLDESFDCVHSALESAVVAGSAALTLFLPDPRAYRVLLLENLWVVCLADFFG